MALYSAAFSLPPIRNTSIAPLFDIRPSPTDYPRVMEINMVAINPTALTLSVGLGLSATVGTARTNAIAFVPYNPISLATGVVIATEWNTVPTVPAAYLRRAALATATTPGKISFVFSGGLLLAPSTALSMWVTVTTAALLTPIYIDSVEVEVDM